MSHMVKNPGRAVSTAGMELNMIDAVAISMSTVNLSSVADALAEGREPRGETAFSSCRPNEFVPHAADIQAFKRLQEPLRDLLAGCVGAVAEFGGDADEWVPLETMQRLVNGWRHAGGDIELQLYPGANHGFMTGKPDAPYARPAIERIKAFIRKHTG